MPLLLFVILFILVVALLRRVLRHILNFCPRCKRELDPANHRGFVPGLRQFCDYCHWEADDNEY